MTGVFGASRLVQDLSLVQRALEQGDPCAQRALVRRLEPQMARQIGRRRWPARTKPEQLELLQALLIRLFCPGNDARRTPPVLKNWRPELGSLDHYVLGFVRTRLRLPPRAPRPVAEINEAELASADPSPQDQAVALGEAEYLLSQLSAAERQLFVALFLEQREVEEICEELEVSCAVLYQRKRRLRRKLEAAQLRQGAPVPRTMVYTGAHGGEG